MIEIQKRVYDSPAIQVVKLDNEISLQLASPTPDPDEARNLSAPDHFNEDPYGMA